MIGKALDQNNDIIIRGGRIAVVQGGAETVQHVRSRLLFYLEEWFLDLTAGTPWFQQIFIKPANLANVESILKQRVLETPDILALTEFAMDFDNTTRVIKITFTAETTYGIISQEEVTLNG